MGKMFATCGHEIQLWILIFDSEYDTEFEYHKTFRNFPKVKCPMSNLRRKCIIHQIHLINYLYIIFISREERKQKKMQTKLIHWRGNWSGIWSQCNEKERETREGERERKPDFSMLNVSFVYFTNSNRIGRMFCYLFNQSTVQCSVFSIRKYFVSDLCGSIWMANII